MDCQWLEGHKPKKKIKSTNKNALEWNGFIKKKCIGTPPTLMSIHCDQYQHILKNTIPDT